MNLSKIFITAFVTLFITSTASASIVLNPSVFYYTREESQGGSTTEFNQQIINVKLGYMDGGLYFGFAYDMESRDSGGTSRDRKSTGGTIGYMNNNWNLMGTYYFSSEYDDYDGTGYAVDLGYIISLSRLSFGPLLTYRHFSYDKQGGARLDPELEHNNLLPAIQFMFVF